MGEGGIERIGGKLVYRGPIASVRIDRFKHPDGGTTLRQIVMHPGVAAVVAHDGKKLYLVRQPREAVGAAALLELPAGKLDAEGDDPLECAQRELAEEVGKGAGHWELLSTFFVSPGITNEQVHLFLATELYDSEAASGEEERIEIVTHPLEELDALIADSTDAKTIIGLMVLRDRLQTTG